MNCFDLQNRASDYLDGTLIASLKREADQHLEDCAKCSTRHKHYRLLLTSVASQPRIALPVAIRKAPLAEARGSSQGPKDKRFRIREKIKLWSTAPWYIRVPVEGAGIVLAISLAVSAGPKLRALYERKVERSLTEYNEGFSSDPSDSGEKTAQLSRGNTTAPGGDSQSAVGSDDFGSSEGNESAADSDTENEDEQTTVIKAGASETWRFNLKTDSPHDVRTKIVQILADLNVPPATPGIGGIEAPGGIQFDLLIPRESVPDLKTALQKIAPIAPKDAEDTPMSETFTWYKTKSKLALPAGQTHVVIWLSQI
jgi:hypothetical protein